MVPKLTRTLMVIGAALLSVAQAQGDKITVLLPCGQATQEHAIVPDAKCQKISESGAFSILALHGEAGIKLGFSATPDCKQTYTPSYEELNKLMQGKNCNTYVVSASSGSKGGKTPSKGDGKSGNSPGVDPYKMADAQLYAGPGGKLHRRMLSQSDLSKREAAQSGANGMPLRYVALVKA